MKRPSIAIVGAGRLGSALAVQLVAAGYQICEIVSRKRSSRAKVVAQQTGAELRCIFDAILNSHVVWLCVPDSQIRSVSGQLRDRAWKGKVVFHSSGVLTSAALEPLREKGASVASVHPLMTFMAGSAPDLKGVPFALEGDEPALSTGRGIVRGLGGVPFVLDPRDKAAYHTFATLICPLLVALLTTAERLASSAGISGSDTRRRMIPIIRQTLANYERMGARNAFTGPIVRGDTDTVRLHLKTLAREPAAEEVYRALARAALQYLPSKNTRVLGGLLSQTGEMRRSSKRTGQASTRSTRPR